MLITGVNCILGWYHMYDAAVPSLCMTPSQVSERVHTLVWLEYPHEIGVKITGKTGK